MSKINEYKSIEQLDGSEILVVETNDGTRSLPFSLVDKRIQETVDNSVNYTSSDGISINNGVISADETLARKEYTVNVIKTIDMTGYTGRNSLALSVVDENKEWVANTELFPEYGIYKLINAKGKAVCGGGSTPKSNSKIQLKNDTVYINYQQNTVDIYDDRHYTVYHTYNNTGTSEQWTDFFHITDLEINEKIANAVPFVNKPNNANQIKVIDGDFDSGAINRIVFPCTLYDYADNPLIALKINDLVSVSYDDWGIGYVQVITKEGIYNFKMCAGADEETGDYIYDDPPPLSDCILPTMGEIKKQFEEKWILLIDDVLADEVASGTQYGWSSDINGNAYSVKELFAEIVFPSELSGNLALQINGADASAIMWGLLPAKTKKVHIHSKMLPDGCIETEYVYKLSTDSEITSHKSLKGINGERRLTAFTKLSISSRPTSGSVALPSGTAVKIWAMK